MNDAQLSAEPSEFEKWLCREMPSGTIISDPHWWAIKIQAALAQRELVADTVKVFNIPRGLHPNTANLVGLFAEALAYKLEAAERKYGYSDGWKRTGWMDECREDLLEHVQKGDPRDVAAYCAFLWHHGESTTPKSEPVAEGGVKRFNPHQPTGLTVFPMMGEIHNGAWVRFDDWQRAEAARLMAVSDLELARMQNDGMMSELYRELELEPDEVRFKWVMIAISDLKRQLTAERARSEKLVEAAKACIDALYKDQFVPAKFLNAFEAAYQYSKENGK